MGPEESHSQDSPEPLKRARSGFLYVLYICMYVCVNIQVHYTVYFFAYGQILTEIFIVALCCFYKL